MIELFEKYVDWKILAYFLRNPSKSVYVKELSRLLAVSPGSTSTALSRFKEWGIVIKDEKAQTHFYELNNELPFVKGLKSSLFLIDVHEIGFVDALLELEENIISIALYGSLAAGDFDSQSDMDLLVISPKKIPLNDFIENFNKKLGRDINIEVFSLAKWNLLKKKEKPFYNNVMRNHVLLYGGELI